MKIAPLSKTYNGRRVLDMPELELINGKVYAVIGANGSGKSTLAKILSGVEDADSGKAPIPGINTGYMPQKNFAFRMSLEKNILLNGDDSERALSLMNSLGITHLAATPAKKLSGGEMARMTLARLLMKKYELLILDEPTAAMDMVSTVLSEKLIEEYHRETLCTILLVTHSLQQAKRMADEVIYLDNGELKEFGDAEKLFRSPKSDSLIKFLQFYGG